MALCCDVYKSFLDMRMMVQNYNNAVSWITSLKISYLKCLFINIPKNKRLSFYVFLMFFFIFLGIYLKC